MPSTPRTATQTHGRAELLHRLLSTRRATAALVEGLSAEDMGAQSMPDASPAKWHLAHTSWFFETLLLLPHAPLYRAFDRRFALLFNSYYEALGPRHPRPQRGLLTRPALAEVLAWREKVDLALQALVEDADEDTWHAAGPLLELGLQHEQQHQELLVTDLLHLFSLNPLQPAWKAGTPPAVAAAADGWVEHPGGLVEVGHAGPGFAFDNETPRHRVYLQPFAIANRLVTNAEFQAFIDDGGYRRAALWLSEGWAAVQAQGWTAPLYWQDSRPGGAAFGVHGLHARQADAPVCHLSYCEAAAYAEWAGARLPCEAEWEVAAGLPVPPAQCHGLAWQWTRSAYSPYPGFRPWPGAVGEYNGKFMVGQMVLRGSSSATPAGHARHSYRNFFPPGARWQFSGLRLAQDR